MGKFCGFVSLFFGGWGVVIVVFVFVWFSFGFMFGVV